MLENIDAAITNKRTASDQIHITIAWQHLQSGNPTEISTSASVAAGDNAWNTVEKTIGNVEASLVPPQ